RNKELKFDFHIEAKPGGGFSIHSHDPNVTTIEGASHEEIEHPFAEKLAGVVGKYLLPELSQVLAKQGGSGDVKVFVDRKVSFTTNPSSHKPARDNKQNDNLKMIICKMTIGKTSSYPARLNRKPRPSRML